VRELPPPAGPPASPALVRAPAGTIVRARPQRAPGALVATLHGGRVLAVLLVRERRLEYRSASTSRRLASAPVGVGPTHVACLDAGPCYVADTQGQALLVVREHPLRVARRLDLPGGPYGLALDKARRRLWVTLPARNEVVELPAHQRPHVLARYPTVRGPDAVAVDPRTSLVTITASAAGVLQLLRPR